jgi:SHS family sialic acid transporter-like MFS transporter
LIRWKAAGDKIRLMKAHPLLFPQGKGGVFPSKRIASRRHLAYARDRMIDSLKTAATRGRYLALAAAFLGWLFDGMEMGIFPLVAKPALSSMGESPEGVNQWMGIITALFLVGAAAGGFLFGWLGDKYGRVKAMTWSILCYSIFSGACYFAQVPWHLGACRFLAALGMGGEWSLGVALVMELWPSDKRPWLAAAIGTSANLGYCLIAVIKISFEIGNWRTIMIIGALPALLTFVIRLFVPESEKWQESVAKAPATPMRDVFGRKQLKTTLLAICFAGVALLVTWGAVQWIPLLAGKLAGEENKYAASWGQLYSSMGAALGCLLAPFIGQWLGRRPAYFLLCALALISCQVFFRYFQTYGTGFLAMAGVVGFWTGSFYGWLPLYLPELFPTRSRATGQGIAFNSGRLIAAVGALNVGLLTDKLGGYASLGILVSYMYLVGMVIIWLAPETKNRPLPE